MDEQHRITSPVGEDDLNGAFSVFEGFFVIYQPTFAQVECYLEKAMQEMEPVYAAAYRPWRKAVHDLIRGVFLTSEHIALSDPEAFMEALKIFSFDSAIQFLNDVCISSHLPPDSEWSERFRRHINILLESAAILQKQQQI